MPDQKFFTSQCLICTENHQDSSHIIQGASEFSDAELNFHNSLVLLKQNEVDKAYNLIITSIAHPLRKPDSNLMDSFRFLQSKILYYKHLYTPALQSYQALLLSGQYNLFLKKNILANMGEIYLNQNDLKSGLSYLESYIQLHDSSDLSSAKNVYSNLSVCLFGLGRYTEANEFLQKSISIARQLKDTLSIAKSYLNLANHYYSNYEDAKALKYFKEGLQYAIHSKDLETLENAYINLSIVEEQHNNFSSSLQYRKKYEQSHDSIFNRDKIWELADKQKRLDSQISQQKLLVSLQKNKLQASELNAQALQLKARNLQRNIFLILFISFLVFFSLALYAYRQKIQQNKIITAQREELDTLNHTKDQLFSVVAHDLRSPVQTLKITLGKLRAALTDNDIGRAEQVSTEIENISNGTYSLLNNLLHWSLSQTGQLHFAKDKLNARKLADQVLYDYVPVATARDIRLTNEVDESLFCFGDMNTIKIILRNLVDNAIKFSEPGLDIMISGNEKNGECILSVTDSGKGIDDSIIKALADGSTKRVNTKTQNGQSTGIGLWLVKTMAERNGGTLQIERRIKGTKINVHLPQYQNHE